MHVLYRVITSRCIIRKAIAVKRGQTRWFVFCVVRRTAAADDDVRGWSRWRNWSGERLSGDWVFEEPVSGTRAEPVIMTLFSWEKTVFVYTTCRAAMRSTDVPRSHCSIPRTGSQRIFTYIYTYICYRGLP